MSIMREEELLQCKLQFIRVKTFHINEIFVESDMDVKDFLDFCIAHGIDTVFYKYTYYDKQDYWLPLKMLQEKNENTADLLLCAKWADAYNDYTETIDFTEPCGLTLVAAYGAMNIIVVVQNEWLDRENAVDALKGYQEAQEIGKRISPVTYSAHNLPETSRN